MRTFTGPLGPLSIVMAAALLVLVGSTPADAEPPDRATPAPAASPAPSAQPSRAAPLSRYAPPTSTNGFTALVENGAAFAAKLTQADQVAAEIVATQSQLGAISDDTARRSAGLGRLEREAQRLADPRVGIPTAPSADEVDATLEIRALAAGLQARLDALVAQQNTLARAG